MAIRKRRADAALADARVRMNLIADVEARRKAERSNVGHVRRHASAIRKSAGGKGKRAGTGGGGERADGTRLDHRTPHPASSISNNPVENNNSAQNSFNTGNKEHSNAHHNQAPRPGEIIIRLPNKWAPRHYQLPDLAALDRGIKRVVSVWHRRAGKDSCALNHTARAAHRRVGVYWHMLPTAKQAREVVWTNVDKQGRRMIDQAFPKELRKRTLEDEMTIEFKNGSFWKLKGADNFDSNVGANPAGIVFSEYAITDPRAWDYMRPILLENDGWAWFISTPRGKNHLYDLFERAKKDPLWFASLCDVTLTKLVTPEQIEQERREGMVEERVQQEYFCRFDVADYGTIYGADMEKAEIEGRVTTVPYDPRFPVHTAWDFGLRDATAIWFVQFVGKEIRVIDFHFDRNKHFPHYCNVVNQKGYSYIRHIAPHDATRESYTDGDTLITLGRNHGVNFTVAPKLPVADGIEDVRALLPRCTFDAVKCEYGINALKQYRRKYDEKLKTLSKEPVHDWASDPCDALRTLAVTPEFFGAVPGWYHETQPEHTPPAWMTGGKKYDPLHRHR